MTYKEPAFPFHETGESGQRTGMTLRDWFAGMALQGVYTAGVGDLTEAEIAADAYRMADSMITARAASEPA